MKAITWKEYIRERRRNRGFVLILGTYLLFCLFSAIWFCIDFQIQRILLSIAYMAFVPLLLLFERIFSVRCKEIFTIGVLAIAVGAILGSCFDFYTRIPFFDTVLHGVSGVMFTVLGFALARVFFGDGGRCKRRFFGCLLFAMCFSLAIATVWEIFEYTATNLLGLDMMEDTVVNSIRSYLLAGTHSETVVLEDIVKTVIYYGDGQSYTINGYLDIGLIDTLTDMIICTVGTVVFALISAVSFFKFPRINELLIPKVLEPKRRTQENEEMPVSSVK